MRTRLVLALLALPSSSALASEVAIYGKLTGAIQSTRSAYSDDDLGTTTKVDSYDSYLGFRGTEDLGSGLKAIWQVEQAIALDGSEPGGWASRDSFIGLSGQWGTLQAGYLSNFQNQYSRLDPQKATGWIGMSYMFNNAITAAFTQGRVRNAMAYTSPEWNGLTGRVLYSAAGEGRSIAGNRESLYEIGLRYTRAGFYGQYAYTHANNSASRGESFPVDPNNPGLGDLPAQGRIHYAEVGYEANGWLAALTYVNRLLRADAFFDPLSSTQRSPVEIKARAIGVNLAYTLGRWTPHFQYQHGWQPSTFESGTYGDNTGYTLNQYVLGVDYALSKRTELQAAAGYLKVGNHPLENKPFLKGHTLSLGLSHRF
ncbi:MAG: porin [Laribacter sp.]|nr:porin [Laribacter sp.]MBP9528108.1 porin [Laribacter sp.]MBP9610034.1 porin [Laribacter sp.]